MAPLPGSEWRVQVKFLDQGLLHAEAQGTLQLMPEDALRIITHPAGDELFRVVDRCAIPVPADGSCAEADQGIHSVEIENRAPVRVIAYKFWAVSRVRFDVQIAKPPVAMALSAAGEVLPGQRQERSLYAAQPGRAGSSVTFKLIRSNMLKQLTGSWHLEPLLAPKGGHQVLGTHLCYQHDVRPKGLPPGVQFVPGMSGAVKMSVAREVRQMVDKVAYVADKVSRGLPVVVALEQTVDELRAAGGSFKKMRAAQLRVESAVAERRANQAQQQLKSVPLKLDFELMGAEP